MSFTDEDLKLMKIQMYEPDQTMQFHWPEEKLKALISRLEAAEKCIPYHECQDDLSTCPHLEAWRKAAGK